MKKKTVMILPKTKKYIEIITHFTFQHNPNNLLSFGISFTLPTYTFVIIWQIQITGYALEN